jgi:hypothetical protein
MTPVEAAIRYFRARLARMDYAGARRQGLPIGSGNVEAFHHGDGDELSSIPESMMMGRGPAVKPDRDMVGRDGDRGNLYLGVVHRRETKLADGHVELDLAPPVGHRPASTKATISSTVG